jgi:phage terminase small subunit
MSHSTKLTPKQRRFVAEYCKDTNATQAAIRCGYSARSAKQQGARLMTIAAVAQAVAERTKGQLAKADVTAERVLEELARIAFVSADELYEADGSVKPIDKMSAAARSAISQLSILKQNVTAGDGKMDTVLNVRLNDKLRALEMLAKRCGLLTEKVEVTGLDDLVGRLARARARVKG